MQCAHTLAYTANEGGSRPIIPGQIPPDATLVPLAELADRAREPEARNLLVTLAGEEKSHLKVLTGFLDTRPGGAQETSAG